MKITNFNQSPATKIAKINKYLKEAHGVKVGGFHTKSELQSVREQAEMQVITLRNSNKKFNLSPEYAKYLGVKDVIDVMMAEGMYAEGPAALGMKSEVQETVKQLMDSGYTMDEASAECMNRFRQDSRFAYDDDFVLPIVLKAAKDYYESCGSTHEGMLGGPSTDLGEALMTALAKECGVELTNPSSIDAIEEKLNMFAQVSGKSRDSVAGFLNSLEEEALTSGIRMFGAKIGEANKPDFLDLDNDGNKKEPMKKAAKDARESHMFDDIIGDMLAEEVDVEQAEVVMAARALADDIQDMIARLGKMQNEDVPAIADQMRAEMGAEVAAGFNSQMGQTLSAHLDATKATKDAMETAIAQITGDAPLGAPGGDMGLAEPTADVGEEEPTIDDMAMDTVEPAAAGPEDEPLGRAPVEI
jgi:hypothetical protein